MAPPLITVAGATRPHPGETANGDAWAVEWPQAACRIALIDALGHGPDAAAVARQALGVLAAHPLLEPVALLGLCHRALAGTRGVVLSIATIDPLAATLCFAGVGNVEARLWQPSKLERPITYRGIVGRSMPTVRAFRFALEPGWLLLLHTDGVSDRFDLTQAPGFPTRAPRTLAEAVLTRWGRPTDDATVVVACATAGPEGR